MIISNLGLSRPKTKTLVYQDVLSPSNAGTIAQLEELTALRKAIVESICDNNPLLEATTKEMFRAMESRYQQDVQKIEEYIPLLNNLYIEGRFSCSANMATSNPKITWSSVFTTSSFFNHKSPKYYKINDWLFETSMMLFLYGLLLRERALQLLSSDLVQSATLYRKAAGVYDCLANDTLRGLQLQYHKECPPEALPCLSEVMSLICLAEAQAVTARKAEQNSNSGGLLAKLHNGVKDFLVEATDSLNSAMLLCKDMSSHLSDFVSTCKTLHELEGHKHLAKSLNNDDKIGVAIGVLQCALTNVQKTTPKEDSLRSAVKQATEEVKELLHKYERQNDFVSREKVPAKEDLPSPQSVKIVKAIPHDPETWYKNLFSKEKV